MLRRTALLLLPVVTVLGACSGSSSPDTAARQPPSAEERKAARLLNDLSGGDGNAAARALDEVVIARDRRFVSVLIELMRADEIGILPADRYRAHVGALERLSGKRFGADWPAWVKWYASTDLRPPPGFTGWKGRLLGQVDLHFAEFLKDDAPVRVRVEEVQWGGVMVDGIPALDNAQMVRPARARYLEPGEPVFGLSLNGHSRAYPLRILDWHELANDVVGGVPVSLAYCTLCGAGIAYDGRASNGQTYTFGSSGLLFRSNKLMYDRQTRTLWNQLTGKPVIGRLAGTDVSLRLLPLVLTKWKSWRAQHPDTVVLDIATGFDRPYELGAAYGDYFASPRTMFPVRQQRRGELPEKARVYGLRIHGIPKAYPISRLAAERVVNDVVGGTPIVLVATRGVVTVAGRSRRAGPVSYEAGAEIRAFRRGARQFRPGPDPDTLLDEEARPWRVTEEALAGPTGARAARVPGHLAYWFGWYSFFPNTLLYDND
jgi:hypothetical protein